MTKTFIRIAWVLAASLAVSAQSCQTDRVSLDEAKKIATGIQGPRFEAPPNSINDIITLMNADRPEDRARLTETLKAADAHPAAGLTGSALSRFYAARAEAAQRLGRTEAASADYQRAVDSARQARTVMNTEWTGWAFAGGMLTIDSGDLVKGLKMIEDANAAMLPDLKVLQLNELGQAYGRVMGYESMIAIVNARLGDLASARAALGRARSIGVDFNSLISYGRSNNALTAEDTIGIEIATGTLRAATGRVAALSGSLDEGISEMRGAIERLSRYQSGIAGISGGLVVNLRVEALSELAAMLSAKGETVEAEVVARQGLAIAVQNLGRYNRVTSSALARLGEILLVQGRYDQAEAVAKQALADLAAAQASRHARPAIESRMVLARAQAARHQWAAALDEFRTVEAALKEFAPRYAEFALAADTGFATTALYGGEPALAVAAADVERRWRIDVLGPDAYLSIEASAFLGAAQWRAGRKDEARQALSAWVPRLVAASGSEKRPFLARMRTEAIIGALLAASGAERGASGGGGSTVEAAFKLAEATRSGKLAESLNTAAARASASRLPGLSELIRQKDDVELKTDAANRMLAEALVVPGIARDDPRLVTLRRDAAQLSAAAKTLQGEIEGRFPDYRALASPPSANFASVSEALTTGEALVSIFDGTERTFVWAIPKSGPSQMVALDLGARELATTIATLRRALAPEEVATLGDIPAFDLKSAYQLYAKLLKPVEGVTRDARHLIVVATGVVPSLPLAVLPTEPVVAAPEAEPMFTQYRRVPWLIRRSATSYVPSAATLIAIRRLPPTAGTQPFVGFGDPVFGVETAALDADAMAARGGSMRGAPIRLRASPPISDRQVTLADLPRLADTAREIEEVARALNANPGADVFLRERANEDTVKQMSESGALSNYRVISFATHGLVPGELSGLRQPALALTNPRNSKAASGDGLLTLDEVLGLKLDADWAVLSACNTGGSDGSGSEALSGLGQAFFFAGSRALLVSNWPVHSDATASLMIAAFRAQTGGAETTRASAMREAMLQLIDGEMFRLPDGREGFSYAHPLFWAPFSVIGDGGTLRRRSAS